MSNNQAENKYKFSSVVDTVKVGKPIPPVSEGKVLKAGAYNEEANLDWKKSADELYNELQRQKKKLEVYRNAINSIAVMGHVDIKGQYEQAFNGCLELASKAYIDSGDYEDDQL